MAARKVMNARDINTGENIYILSHAKATYMSDNRTVEDAINSINTSYKKINHGIEDTSYTLTPNILHVWDEVTMLNLSLGDEIDEIANEFIFQFTSGSTATSLTLPDNVKWANNVIPSISSNKIYQVSILNNLGSILEFNI